MRRDTDAEATSVAKYAVIGDVLNERSRRLWAVTESGGRRFARDAVRSMLRLI